MEPSAEIDGKFADIDPVKLEIVQREILGIEPVKPPTFAEKLRDKLDNFWYKYEHFVYIGLLALGAGMGEAMAWRLAESEEARKSFVQVAMIGTGILGGTALALGAIFVGGCSIHAMVEKARRKQ